MKGENRKITYQGKEYDGYSATQEQRKIERTIRKYKRFQIAYRAAGLDEEATIVAMRLQRLNKEYTAFSNAAGLKRNLDRIYVDS